MVNKEYQNTGNASAEASHFRAGRRQPVARRQRWLGRCSYLAALGTQSCRRRTWLRRIAYGFLQLLDESQSDPTIR